MPDSLERHTNIVKQDWMQGNTIWCSADAYEACKEAMKRLADALDKEPIAFPVPPVGDFNEREQAHKVAVASALTIPSNWQLATLSGKQLDDFAAQFGWPVRFGGKLNDDACPESDDAYRQRLIKFVFSKPDEPCTDLHGWLLYRHPEGQWVTLRKATDADIAAISKAVVDAHHCED